MAFTWTDKMKNVGARPELEDATRAAVIAAMEVWSELPVDGAPRFNGGHFLNPANELAEQIVAKATGHLAVAGRDRAAIITTAVAAASVACAQGRRGDKAWERLTEVLLRKQPSVTEKPAVG